MRRASRSVGAAAVAATTASGTPCCRSYARRSVSLTVAGTREQYPPGLARKRTQRMIVRPFTCARRQAAVVGTSANDHRSASPQTRSQHSRRHVVRVRTCAQRTRSASWRTSSAVAAARSSTTLMTSGTWSNGSGKKDSHCSGPGCGTAVQCPRPFFCRCAGSELDSGPPARGSRTPWRVRRRVRAAAHTRGPDEHTVSQGHSAIYRPGHSAMSPSRCRTARVRLAPGRHMNTARRVRHGARIWAST